MKLKDELPLRAQIVVSKVALNAETMYSLSQENDWVNDLLVEMCEHASTITMKILKPKIFLNLELSLSKKTKPQMGEFLLISGKLETCYATECVKTLKPMLENLNIEFHSAFLSEEMNQKDQYSEVDEIFEDNNVYQIYFYQKNTANIKEMIHEIIYLHYNQYPTIDTALDKNNDV